MDIAERKTVTISRYRKAVKPLGPAWSRWNFFDQCHTSYQVGETTGKYKVP